MDFLEQDQRDVDAIARNWVVRLVSGDVDEETLAAFKTWQAADAGHARAFDRARRLYAEADRHHAVLRPRSRWRRPEVGLALAASLALAVFVARPEFLFPPDYVTPDGPARAFALADGTGVLLDGDSAIDVRIDGDARKVHLRRGRAYFTVRHEGRPFTVAYGDGVVTDIGTAFTVGATGPGGEVVVTQGVVRVDAHGDSETLSAGHAARWDGEGVRGFRSDMASLAWTQQQIVIRDQTLTEAAVVLDRYVPGRIIVLGDVGNARVGGTFSTGHAAEGLEALARSQDARITRLPGITIVSGF
jgi:transmembrane sensor